MLQELKDDPQQHFHLSSDYAGEGGLGDIEVFVQDSATPGNMRIGGVALAPGSEVPDSEP
jgi:hypothetical protein